MKNKRIIPLLITAPLIMGFFYVFSQNHLSYKLTQNNIMNRRGSHTAYQRVLQTGALSGLIWVKAYPTAEPSSHKVIPMLPTSSFSETQPTIRVSTRATATPHSDGLTTFIQSVTNGQSGVIAGLYAEGVLALHVVQQPVGEAGFVSYDAGTATLFQSALPFGVTGLLAHNFLSGKSFFSLQTGQEVDIIYGDGSLKAYRIDMISDFQRVAELDLRSDFQDIHSGDRITSSEVFNRFYTGPPHLTLQTCLEKNGDLNWGVRFIVAQPITTNP